MIVTDKSSIITFAVPVFFVLIIIEYLYGRAKGKKFVILSGEERVERS